MTTRPRLASITREDGEVEALTVESTEDPQEFVLTALDGGPVVMGDGDRIWVDVLGPGQSVRVQVAEDL